MFRRLFATYSLLVLVLLTGLALLVVLVVQDEGDRMRVLVLVCVTIVLALIGLAALSARVAWQITRPLEELGEAVERMAAGSPRARVFSNERGEFRLLGQTFNRMSEHLGTRIAQLEEDRQQLRTILSGMAEGVVALDADLRILYANDRAAELLEFPTTTPVGRHLWQVVRHRPLLDAVRQAQESADPCRAEVRWAGVTPRSLTVVAVRLPGLSDTDLRPRGAVLVLHDTSELRRLERLRQEFVANVSHELKTPLSVIKVHVETLIDGAIEDAQNRGHFLEQIARQSDRLHALILDLLSLARIESGEEVLDFEEVAIGSVTQATVERHRPRAEARNQRLTITPGPDVCAWADEEALDQILENLLDNALKYTQDGGQIEVRWHLDEDHVEIEVSDTGIGIPAADLPRIFERFYRVDKARSREMGGTGLGLSIVKHLAQALRGSIRASSEFGKGTTFTLALPLFPSGLGNRGISL